MAIRTASGCQCRVPIDEAAIPVFSRTDELVAWADQHGVSLELDHLDRLSVSVSDAYRLRDEANEIMRRHAEEQAKKAASLAREVQKAQERRQSVFSKVYITAMGRSAPQSAAVNDAREAVRAAEAGTRPEVLNQLSSPLIPNAVQANVGRVVGPTSDYAIEEGWTS